MPDSNMQRSAMQVFRFPDIDALAASYDTSDAEFTRFSRASFSAELTLLDLGACRLRVARFGEPGADIDPAKPVSVLRAGWRQGRAAVFVPIGAARASVVNGQRHAANTAVLVAPGGEVHNVAAARHQDWAAMDLDAEAFAALLDAFGLPPLACGAHRGIIMWGGGRVAALPGAILGAIRDAARFSDGVLPHALLSALRERVMDALMADLAGMAGGCDTASRRTRENLRIVAAVDALLRDQPARPLYTDELCAALGVSPRKLFDAFAAAYGMSPHRFLKCRRLSLVRRALHTARPDRASVKWAALSHGFLNMGRFAREYHGLFGEMPSRTLADGRA